MDLFQLFAAVLSLAALLSFVNHRWLGLPTTIGVMVLSLVVSLLVLGLHRMGIGVLDEAASFVVSLEFEDTLLQGMLALLLFAGALHVDLGLLLGQKRPVFLLATVGVLVTTGLVGLLLWLVAQGLDVEVDLLSCLLFGALIAPTDPIAVIRILKDAGVPKSLETKFVGESLFNDGVGVVVFTLILGIASVGGGHESATVGSVLSLFGREIVGSIAVGLFAGWLVYRMLAMVDDYKVEILLTLALAVGLYSLEMALHMSGPLAVVVAGLLIGGTGRKHAMSETTRRNLDTFWELVDEILNVVLFALIGLELLVIELDREHLIGGLVAIPVVLFARFVSVGGTVQALRGRGDFAPHTVKILTWGGLRGGISVALALSIGRDVAARDWILGVTYVVVVFSILVQGLTIGRLARAVQGRQAQGA
jgi:CPA1 family monovalent cation:H+ antiporter